MYTGEFEYHRPGSVDEALSLLGEHGDEAKLLAGGHSLIPVMKLRFAQPAHLIDISRVDELSGIREEDGAIVIGAGTVHRAVERSELLAERIPVLPAVAAVIGDPQVRNRGTVGGSLVHADPGADWPAVMLALGAELTLRGPSGARSVPAHEFFTGLMTTAVAANEILTGIRVPVPGAGTGAAYESQRHPATGFAVVGVAASVTMAGGSVDAVRVGITGLHTHAVRAAGVEEAFQGSAGDASAVEAAAQRAAEGLTLRADRVGSEAYKAHLAGVYTRRALTAAVDAAG